MSTSTRGPDARHQRLLSYTSANMVYSLLAVVAVAFGWWALMPNPDSLQRRPVEVTSVAAFAAEQAPWEVWVPEGTGEEWTPNTVRYADLADVPTWRMGFVSPAGDYVALDQAGEVTDGWRAAVLGDAQQQGSTAVDGPQGTADWELWVGEDETFLVRPGSGGEESATTVVHGTADQEELVDFIGYLEPYRP